MDKVLRIELLRSGGKKALAEYNRKNRAIGPVMNLGTRVHTDKRYAKPKYKEELFQE